MIFINEITFFCVYNTFETFLTIFYGFFFLKQYSIKMCSVFPFPRYSHLRFVRTAEVLCADLPLLPAEFEGIVQRHCGEARDILQNKSVPALVAVDK